MLGLSEVRITVKVTLWFSVEFEDRVRFRDNEVKLKFVKSLACD